jgi:hypothetical protein
MITKTAMPTNQSLSSYLVRDNTINLTTVNVDSSNKGYLVDQKLIDILLGQLVNVSFKDFKENLLNELRTANNLEELTARFADGVYIQTVIAKLPVVEPVVEETPTELQNGPKYSIDD